MDVENDLNINAPIVPPVQSTNVHEESAFYASLGLKYIREVADQIHVEEVRVKSEINEVTTKQTQNNFSPNICIKSENVFESSSDIQNNDLNRSTPSCTSDINNSSVPHTLKTEQFNDLLYSGAALQVQINERRFKEGVCLKYFCSYCSKGFAKKQQLQNHIKTHTNEKNFKCKTCDKRFVHKQQLSNHEKTHTGKKDFECVFCSKRFILKQQMQIHSKIHTGEKNFECNMCDKKFITKQQLQNHINSHLGVKPFTCDICQKPFAHKQQLLRHQAHHEKQVHFCALCNLKLKGKSLFNAHLDTVHGIVNSGSLCNMSTNCL